MAEVSAGGMQFRAGRVIARSFSTFFRNILPFGLIALVLTSPTYIYTLSAGPAGWIGMGMLFGYEAIAVFVAELLLTYLVTAALVYGTIQDLRQNRVSVGDCFSQGLARMFPVLGVAILSLIVVALAFIPAAAAALKALEQGGFFIAVALVLIVPGVIVVLMLWVTIPVAVTERRGIGSLARSMELTKGNRWRIFFVILILIVILIALSFLGGIATAGIMMGIEQIDPGRAFIWILVVQWIVSALVSAFMAVVYAVTYHDLRVAREGVDSDQIAAVFD